MAIFDDVHYWIDADKVSGLVRKSDKNMLTYYRDYGITSYGVSRPGIQNKKGFCIKINLPKGNYWILRIGLMGSLSSLEKSEVLKLIILIFHEKKLNN